MYAISAKTKELDENAMSVARTRPASELGSIIPMDWLMNKNVKPVKPIIL